MKSYITEYLETLKAKKLSIHTIKSYRTVLTKLDEYKPLPECTRKDLIDFFAAAKFKDSTQGLYQILIKKYFKDAGKADLVDWITGMKIKETLKSDDILTTEDVNLMIESTENLYAKAVIAFLFETGARISEARSLKYKDLIETSEGVIVHISTTKTGAGFRKLIIPFSAQYIRNLKLYKGAGNDDHVFYLSAQRHQILVKEIAKKAGITKPMSPHKFRHAQATDMVKRGYNETIIRKKLGWTPTSPIIARYQHMNDEDVINATLEQAGTAAPKNRVLSEIKEADKLTLVDAAMQFSKLSEENETLKAEMEKQAADMETMKRQMELITAAMQANAKD